MLRQTVGLIFALSLLSCSKPTNDSGMVHIEGGDFLMGTDRGEPFEGPVHRVSLDDFRIDTTETTNAEFAKFVKATGYVTTAEEIGDSGVFDPAASAWKLIKGADWRHPQGPGSSLDGRSALPVVHVSWDDAKAYCEWLGKRLPTEAEFEFAARGGLDEAEYAWGDEFRPDGKILANTWQGYFPTRDEKEDGYGGIAPVKSFPPNGYGLYDMTGNVWEWVYDWFDPGYFGVSPSRDPRGPRQGNAQQEKTIRGGSWLCSANYCQGYRVAARMRSEKTSGLNNLGFRCAAD